MGQMDEDLQERPLGVLPSNTLTDLLTELNVITTMDGLTLDGSFIPHSNFLVYQEKEQEPKTITEVPLIPYPSRLKEENFQALENPTGRADHFIYRIDIVDSWSDKFPIENNYDSDSLVEETDTLLSRFNDSSPEYKTFSFDMEEKSSGSTTTHSDYSLPDYEAFYFDDNYIEEKSSGSTTTHSQFSLLKYDSFIFDLSIDPLPPSDRSNFSHEEFADELAHIISPPDYPLFLIGSPVTDTLTSFPSGNEDKVFNPRILTTKGFHSRYSLELSYQDSKAFKINKNFKSPMEIFPFFFFLYYRGDVSSLDVSIPKDHEDPCLFSIFQSPGLRSSAYFGILNPDHVHIEVLLVLWGIRLPFLDGSLPLSRQLKDHMI
ncbi:hypothetical protein Tco_0362673 [Tanacetum coccineum]